MSEPMSNREIEDVLTSIRRLVAQEGGRVENGRLILTEAQRVNALSPVAAVKPQANTAAAPVMAPLAEVKPAEEKPAEAPVPEALADSVDVSMVDVSIPAPDFGKLEATIAELEAAVSARGDGFEADSAQGAPRASNVTELYGRLSFSHRGSEPANDAPPAAPVAEPVAPAPAPEPVEAAAEAAPAEPADTPADAPVAPAPVAGVDMAEDDYPEETILDEEALHALISQIVRDELRGQLGERITQQVRKLVRTEIARALEDRDLI